MAACPYDGRNLFLEDRTRDLYVTCDVREGRAVGLIYTGKYVRPYSERHFDVAVEHRKQVWGIELRFFGRRKWFRFR